MPRFLLLAGLAAIVRLAPAQESPRLDGDGDTLPAGAVYRLGTKAWRHTGNAFSPSWSADGQRLAMLCNYREVRIFDGETGRVVLSFVPKDDAGGDLPQCWGVALSPDGEEVAVRTMPATVHFFDAATGKHLRRHILKADDFGDTQVPMRYSPSGKHVAVSFHQTYHVIHAQSGESVIEHKANQGQPRGMAFTDDGKRFMVITTKPDVQVWDLAKREMSVRTPRDSATVADRGLCVAGNARFLAGGGQQVTVLDLNTDQLASRLTSDEAEQFVETAFTPDDKLLVAATQQGTIYAWNVSDWSRKWKLASGAYFSRGLAVRPKSRHVALTDARNRVWLWAWRPASCWTTSGRPMTPP